MIGYNDGPIEIPNQKNKKKNTSKCTKEKGEKNNKK